MLEIILESIACPIIVTLITLYITDLITKKSKLKNEFYISFYELHLKTHRGRAFDFSDLNEIEQEAYIDLIIKNEKIAKGLLLNLFYEFLVSIPFKDEEKIIGEKTNKIFNEITDIVFDNMKIKSKITKKERKRFNKRIIDRTEESSNIFFIKNIDDDGNIHTYEE
ncbi:MAG: hypothetical protein IJE59_00745 [Clostridia bacterium]|nr:hypothetical protein [Clostridia bacterium]